MRRYLLIAAALLGLLSPDAKAANSTVSAMTAASALAGTELMYCVQSAADRKCTPVQLAAYIFGNVSGDLTCNGTGTCTLKNTGPGATGPLGSATVAPIITIDAQGRVTALSSATITQPGAANPSATAGPAANNGAASTFMRSDASPAVQKGSNAQFGIVEGDGSTITCVLGVCSSIGGGGSGTVTSVATGCGATGGTITISGTISAASTLRANTGTTDTIVSTDCGNVVTESNAASIAVALPVASTSGFGAGTFFQVCNIGVGVATVTPTTSQIGGASSKAIQGGTATNPSCLSFQSDGTNYNIVALPVPAGLFTVTGALKGSGAGVISPAACADLSNGAASCSTDTTNAANISSGALPLARIGTGAASHAVPVDVAGTLTYKVIPDCQDSAGNHINYTQSLDAFSCGTSSSGGGASPINPFYITGGTQWYQFVTGMNTGAGAALTANTTAYCFFGSVPINVTIKNLVARVTTGVASSNVEFAIYSFAVPPTNTMTLVDTSAAQASTATSTTNAQTALANTTDNLAAGTLYAVCSAASGAVVFPSYIGSNGASSIIGSSTQANVVGAAPIIGKSFAVTYSTTPSTTFPGTLTLSSGTDITGGSLQSPIVAFEVN